MHRELNDSPLEPFFFLDFLLTVMLPLTIYALVVMLTLSNGRPETILSPKDFEDLIDKHMGMDCANYYQNQIEQLSELIRDLDSYVDDKDVHSTVKEVLKEHGY